MSDSNPGLVNGEVPTADEWNSFFSGKVDAVGGVIQNPTVEGGTIDGSIIGGATPAAGKFTTLIATGTVVLEGTTSNNNAPAGDIGEFIQSSVNAGSGTNLSNNAPADVTSISLTAGDWDVYGNVNFAAGVSTVVTEVIGWINTSSATVPSGSGTPNGGAIAAFPVAASNNAPTFSVGRMRLSLSTTTTVYLSVKASFTVSTLNPGGFIGARRVR
jgi:hypothetical protein